MDAKLEPDVSTVTKATADDAPAPPDPRSNKDEPVSIGHSKNMVPLFEKTKVSDKRVTIADAGQGFSPKQTREQRASVVMDWLVTYAGNDLTDCADPHSAWPKLSQGQTPATGSGCRSRGLIFRK